MHYNTSMAKILWARSIQILFFSVLITECFFYSIVVEFAKESRPRREPYEDRYGYSQIFRR